MNRKQFIRRSALFTLAVAGLSKKAGAFTGERKSWYLSGKTAGAKSLFYSYEVRVYNSDLLQPAEDAKVVLPVSLYAYASLTGTAHLTATYNFNRHGAPKKDGDYYLISFDTAAPTGATLQQDFPEIIRVKLRPDKELMLETAPDSFTSLLFHVDAEEGCFLTTACTQARGLRDDCAELQALRFLRDEHMAETAEGRLMIQDYYRTAPAIVQTINSLPNSREIWALLYADLVLPSKKLVEEKRLGEAMVHYSMYVGWVKELFGEKH